MVPSPLGSDFSMQLICRREEPLYSNTLQAQTMCQIKFGGGGFHGPTSAAGKSSKTQGILNINK